MFSKNNFFDLPDNDNVPDVPDFSNLGDEKLPDDFFNLSNINGNDHSQMNHNIGQLTTRPSHKHEHKININNPIKNMTLIRIVSGQEYYVKKTNNKSIQSLRGSLYRYFKNCGFLFSTSQNIIPDAVTITFTIPLEIAKIKSFEGKFKCVKNHIATEKQKNEWRSTIFHQTNPPPTNLMQQTMIDLTDESADQLKTRTEYNHLT